MLGSNGEAASLDESEKLALIASARRHAGRRTLLAGTGLESTAATIALTRKAADQGADAALVLTPSYYKTQMRTDVLKRHFEAVAEASPIPVLLYSVPAFTGLVMPPELPAALSGHPRIAGLKESSGDIGLMGRILQSVPPSFAVACGSAPVIFPALCIGAAAGILAVACCAPAPTAALYRAFARGRPRAGPAPPAGDHAAGDRGHRDLRRARPQAGHGPGRLHRRHTRAPLMPPPAGARDELAAMLARAEEAAHTGSPSARESLERERSS